MITSLEEANNSLKDKSALAILSWVYGTFDAETIKLSTSFGAEGMVLMSLLTQITKRPRIFTIDTGRNFEETYAVWEESVKRFNVNIETYYPDPKEIKELLSNKGPNLFYDSIENRKACCQVRKTNPISFALADATVWLTGLRKEQSESRKEVPIVSWNEQHKVYKICPILHWTEENVWEYIRNNNIPYNRLHDNGYPTIGCQPCTRPIRPAQNLRSGRWWWEDDAKKECGIHSPASEPKISVGNYQI